jgi:hypothetical protein
MAAKFGKAVDSLFGRGEPVRFADLAIAVGADTPAKSIQNGLERINSNTIDSNPVSRIRKTIQHFNANLAKCAVEVTGIDETKLAPHQIAQLTDSRKRSVQLAMPEVCKEKTYTSFGTSQNKKAKLEVTVSF